MIIDELKNIKKYNIIPVAVINFLFSLTSDTPAGHYEISENAYANIDEYETRAESLCTFEAHKKYIDIQMVLSGKENLKYVNTDFLSIKEEYNEKQDVMFFNTADSDTVVLTPFKFAFVMPHEAHKPQVAFNSNPSKVKKVVVKILAEALLY